MKVPIEMSKPEPLSEDISDPGRELTVQLHIVVLNTNSRVKYVKKLKNV